MSLSEVRENFRKFEINFKKDPKERKTLIYYLRRLDRLRQIWNESLLRLSEDQCERENLFSEFATKYGKLINLVFEEIPSGSLLECECEELKERVHFLEENIKKFECNCEQLAEYLINSLGKQDSAENNIECDAKGVNESAITQLEAAINKVLEDRKFDVSVHESSINELLHKNKWQQKEIERLNTVVNELEENLVGPVQVCVDSSEDRVKELEAEVKVLKRHILEKERELNLVVSSTSKTNPNTKMADVFQKIARLTNEVVPTFSGEGSGNSAELKVFVDCASMVHDQLSVDERLIFMKYIKTRFRGDAYSLMATKKYNTFKDLTEILYKAYLPTRTLRDLTGELSRMIQRPGESVDEFGMRLTAFLDECKTAAKNLYAEDNGALLTQLEKEAICAFMSGINGDTVKRYILGVNKSTLEEYINEATKYDRQERMVMGGAVSGSTQPSSQDKTLQAIQESLKALQVSAIPRGQTENRVPPRVGNRFENFNRRTEEGLPTCYYCKQKGHIKRDCIHLKNNLYCVNCRGYGHDARSCRNVGRKVHFSDVQDAHASGFLFCQFCEVPTHSTDNCLKKYLAEENRRLKSEN